MRKSRLTAKRGRGRPRIMGPVSLPPTTAKVMPSLPPASPEPAQDPSTSGPTPQWKLAPDSVVRSKAVQIIALRVAGFSDAEIAKTLKMSVKSISPYVYRAGKNGWLELDSPRDRIEYQMLHKVVRNLDQALDSRGILQTGMKEKTAVALKIAEGTVFKTFDQQIAPMNNQTTVMVKVEMPPGPTQQMREETIGGTPAYVDVEITK